MAAGDTSNTIVNQALSLMGDNAPTVSGEYPTFDNSPAGVAAQNLYGPCVAAVARSFEFDFARKSATLAASGNAAPFPMGFSQEYIYPVLSVEVWQIVDPHNTDLNNPLPTNWSVGNATVSGQQTKVIWTDVEDAVAVYNNNPLPSVWDSTFREAVVRRLASEFAMALRGAPETEQNMLQSSNQAAGVAMSRDG